MCMATISLISAILTVNLDNMSDVMRIPRLVRTVAFKYLARVFCLTKEVPGADDWACSVAKVHPQNSNSTDVTSLTTVVDATTKTPLGTELHELLVELRKITSYIDEKESVARKCDEWKLLAKVIDRCLFWICLSLTVIYGVYVTVLLATR